MEILRILKKNLEQSIINIQEPIRRAIELENFEVAIRFKGKVEGIEFAIDLIDQILEDGNLCNCRFNKPGMWHDQDCPMRKLPEITMWQGVND